MKAGNETLILLALIPLDDDRDYHENYYNLSISPYTVVNF